MKSRDRGQFRQDRGRHRFEQSYRRSNFQEIMADKIAEENTETTIIGMIVMIEAGMGLEKGHFPKVMTVI